MKRREFTDDGIYIRARESAQESHGKQPEAQTGDETEKVVVFGMETSLHLRIPERVKNEQKRLQYLQAAFKGRHRPFRPNENPATSSSTGELTEADYIYLNRAYGVEDRLARFRMTLKVHKIPNPKMRPIVCCAGTRMNHISKWLDFQLQRLKPFVPTYIKDSHDLLAKLRNIGGLPPNARLFTADAVSMYTNIDTEHAIRVIHGIQIPIYEFVRWYLL
ncbi:hypothetical protein THAOC_36589 [Thalassiosira oceanica]|uniref:Reverse transcriptase domain-containing protein n=1 Tax=Thalassiosira oceanica TaxID=159749 RepID=K0RE93_THAOC|nr:hypothetical protein THAOC_36589 [Thalassiosira oceanica]|eukprot:EJK44842.1 hypothetical protein THAOC_36589 [Thalassiosira oceanica]